MVSENATENQELEEILNEIESLQEELRETASSVTPVEEVVEAPDASSPMASLSMVTDEVQEEEPEELPEEEVTPAMSGFALLDAAIEKDLAETQPQSVAPEAADEDEFQETPETEEDTPMAENDSNDGSLTMTLKGSMTLKLNYECAGQTVSVSFGGEFMKVVLADGTEFKIPVGKKTSQRTLKAV